MAVDDAMTTNDDSVISAEAQRVLVGFEKVYDPIDNISGIVDLRNLSPAIVSSACFTMMGDDRFIQSIGAAGIEAPDDFLRKVDAQLKKDYQSLIHSNVSLGKFGMQGLRDSYNRKSDIVHKLVVGLSPAKKFEA